MSVKIRLRRAGRRNLPLWRIVATDSRSPRDGRFLDTLGYYHPLERPAKVGFDVEKTLHWLREGAQPSDTVRALFKHTGMAEIWHKAQNNEDYSSVTLRETITEKEQKIKSKARARMKEAAGAKEAADKAAAEAPAEDAKPEEGKAEPAADKTSE